MNPTRAQPKLRNFKTAALAKQNIVLRHSHVVELDVHMTMRCMRVTVHHHWSENVNAGGVHRNQYLGLLAVGFGLRTRLHHDNHDLASRIPCSGDIVLFTVDDPLVAVKHRRGLNVGGIRRRNVWLSHSIGRANFAL